LSIHLGCHVHPDEEFCVFPDHSGICVWAKWFSDLFRAASLGTESYALNFELLRGRFWPDFVSVVSKTHFYSLQNKGKAINRERSRRTSLVSHLNAWEISATKKIAYHNDPSAALDMRRDEGRSTEWFVNIFPESFVERMPYLFKTLPLPNFLKEICFWLSGNRGNSF